MTSLAAPILVAVVTAFVSTVEAGVQLHAAGKPLGTYGMRPCKRCGSSRLHSRDELLDMDDAQLNKMKNDITKEVGDLEDEVGGLKKKNAESLGKLDKRLSDMNAAYKKFGKDAIDRSAKFADLKAKAAKDFDGSVSSTAAAHEDIIKLQASMDKMRTTIAPYVDKFISGKGWPQGCKCPGAKALLQRLQATLHLASLDIDTDDASEPARRSEALLRRSAKMTKPADQEKYKLVAEVQKLEEKRAKLMQDKTQAISGFSEKQRITLDRIEVAKIKSNLKATTERKYKDSDESLAKTLKDQTKAAGSYLDSAKAKLARLQKSEAAGLKLFNKFKAELTKCKCL